MADRYVNTALGSNGDGSSGNPWNRIPNTASGDAAGNTLSASDRVFVQVGSHTFGERLVISADNLQFIPWHAYGESAPLELTLPVPWAPWLKRTVRIGKGMWTVRNSTGASACVSYGTNRVGVTIDSAHIIGESGSGSGVAMGLSSTTTGTGNALVRSRVSPLLTGGATGVSVNTLNVLLHHCKVDGGAGDTIVISTHANNGNRAGSTDRIIECDVGPCNQGTLTGTQASQVGDEIQQQNGTLNAGLGNLIIKGCYLFRNSAGKQTILFGGQGWNVVYGNLLESLPSDLMTGLAGVAPNGSSIMLNSPWGRNYVLRNVIRQRRGNFAPSQMHCIRVTDGQDTTTSVNAQSDILIASNLLDVDGQGAWSMQGNVAGGRVRVIGNTSIGTVFENSGENRSVAAVGGFTYQESENAWLATSTGYVLNWGDLSSAFKFRNNRYGPSASGYRVMGTDYASAAAGIAAMGAAGCDVTGSAEMPDSLVDPFGMPLAGSPLLLSGDDLMRYRRDLRGQSARRHIGAYG